MNDLDKIDALLDDLFGGRFTREQWTDAILTLIDDPDPKVRLAGLGHLHRLIAEVIKFDDPAPATGALRGTETRQVSPSAVTKTLLARLSESRADSADNNGVTVLGERG